MWGRRRSNPGVAADVLSAAVLRGRGEGATIPQNPVRCVCLCFAYVNQTKRDDDHGYGLRDDYLNFSLESNPLLVIREC